MYEACPAISSWLFEAASQLKTSSVIALLNRFGHVLTAAIDLRRVDRHLLGFVLDRAAMGPDDRLRRHAGVDLVGHADAHLDTLILVDLGAAVQQLLVGARSIRQLDRLPERLAVVGRVRRVAMHEAVEVVRGRVEGVALGHIELGAKARGRLVDQIGHVDDRLFVLGKGGDVLDEVVALARG